MYNKKIMKGRCVAVNKTDWKILVGEREIRCIINNKYMKREMPTVGDYVTVEIQEYGDIHFILDIEKRKSSLTRNYNGKKQIMAANVDVIFVMSSMNNDFDINKIERFAVLGFESGARVVFVLTKKDLTDRVDYYVDLIKERFANQPIVVLSSINKEGLEDLKANWSTGETAVMIGSSGVGKSTLINTLYENSDIKTRKIREKDSKGRHSTTSRNLYTLKDGRVIIDEPGIRTANIVTASNYIDSIHANIDKYSRQCKYKDCNHNNTPGCEVCKAIEKEIISQEQLERYKKYKKKEERRKIISGEKTMSQKEHINNLKNLKKRKN